MLPAVIPPVKAADEVFVATALLHRENPGREEFTVNEIVARARREHLTAELRPSVRVHAILHCVANKIPSPGRYRMLYAPTDQTRRLLRADDDVHPERTGKIWPDPDMLREKYRELVPWAKKRYASQSSRWLDGVFRLTGLGREIWKGEDPDEYVRRLRDDWR